MNFIFNINVSLVDASIVIQVPLYILNVLEVDFNSVRVWKTIFFLPDFLGVVKNWLCIFWVSPNLDIRCIFFAHDTVKKRFRKQKYYSGKFYHCFFSRKTLLTFSIFFTFILYSLFIFILILEKKFFWNTNLF